MACASLPVAPPRLAVERSVALMHARLDGGVPLPELAAAAHLSAAQFRRVFRAVTGQAPKSYYDGLRLQHARQLLQLQRRSVKDVAATLGYSSPFHFSRAFRPRFGLPPSRVRTG